MERKPAWFVVVVFLLAAGCESEQPAPIESAPVVVPAAEGIVRGRIRFVEGYARGVDQSMHEGKPCMLFFTASWCGFCHQMAQEAFSQDAVVGLSEQFVCVLIDADREPEVCRQFQVRGYPTIQFLSPQGVPLNRLVGKKPAHQLLMEMQAALQAVARRHTATSETRRY